MTNYQCHYDSLKVTRDAPAEVIRAAYRSLSQKHHPDKNVGDPEAARVMSRLNSAYSVLSDAEQRKLYDSQIAHGQRSRVYPHAFQDAARDGDFTAPEGTTPAGESDRTSAAASETVNTRTYNGMGSLLQRIRQHATGRDGQIAVTVMAVVVIVLVIIFWLIRKEQQAMQLLQHAAVYASAQGTAVEPKARPDEGTGKAQRITVSRVDALQVPAPSAPQAVAPPAAPKAPEVPPPASKASDFERLTAMLKSMGLGLHKLDLSTPPNAKRPVAPAPEPERAAVPAATPAPAPRLAAAAPVAAPVTERAREEAERPAAPEAPRSEAKAPAEASRASAALVASAAPVASAAAAASTASASAASRHPVIADARACAPSYPANSYSNGDTGTVQLALLVNGDGKVVESKVQKTSGYPELDKAARKALSQCKFKFPGNERPAESVWARLEYVFSLD